MAVMLIVMASIPVWAENSVFGTRGLIYVPSADTQPEGKFNVNFQMLGDNSNFSLNYGLWGNFEIFGNFDNTEGFNETTGGVGIKARIVQETKTKPSLAVGIRNQDLFLTASKILDYKTMIRGHIGFGTNDFGRLYFGFNKMYNPITITTEDVRTLLPVTNFKAEYFDNKVNLGADFYINENFIINLGVENFRQLIYGFGYSSRF